ncbi:MAG: Eco47II family restriction endonuclease [Akkermansia sp.]
MNTHSSTKIYTRFAPKAPSMNSEKGRDIFMIMQDKLLHDRSLTCYLVETDCNDPTRNIPWQVTVGGSKLSHKQIRRISLERFADISATRLELHN